VWVAEHLALSTNVAVKLIDPELAKKESARERFRREATAAAQLRSAHVVQILDHGIDGEQPFIVMELLEGEDLFERLAHRRRLSLRETSRVVTQVARALTKAHAAGIVHRDLKPENVFLVTNEDEEILKVLDFGVAKVSDPAKATMQRTGIGTMIGTPHYMSPEQVKGIGEVDYRADLWALGVIAYQCLTGELPFDSEGVGDLLIKISIGEMPVPSKALPSLPPSFDAWFARACDRDREKRFQSAREMAVALAAVVNGESPKAPSLRPPAPGSQTPTRPAPPPRPALPRPPKAPKNAAVAELLDSSELEDVLDEESSWGDTDIDFDIDEPEFPPPKAARPAAPTLAASAPPPSTSQQAIAPPPSSNVAPVVIPTSNNPFLTPAAPQAPTIRTAPESSPMSPVQQAPGLGVTPHATVSGLSRSGLLPTDPPPELDGSRRRRMVRILFVGLLLGAAGVAWMVIQSQMPALSSPGPAEVESAAPASATQSAPPPPLETSSTAPTATAVDPGKVKRPVRTVPTQTLKQKPRPSSTQRKQDDGTIEIPDVPDDSVPPAP